MNRKLKMYNDDEVKKMSVIMNQLKLLRTQRGLTQEDVAESIGVSRQALAKWEKGDTLPDIGSCIKLADLFGVSLETLARGLTEGQSADGQQLCGCVRMNDKGQITLPVNIREAFGLKPGCMVLVLADTEKGIALVNMGEMGDAMSAPVVPPNPSKEQI